MSLKMVTILCTCLLLLVAQAASDAELEADILHLEEEIGQWRRVNNELLQGMLEMKQQMMRLKGFSQVPKNDTSDLEARVNVLEENVDDLGESVSDLEADVAQINDDVNNIELDNIFQDQRLNIIEADVSDNEDELKDLVDNVYDLGGSVVGVQTQVSDVADDVSGLDQRVSDLESSSGGGGANVTDLTERVEALEEVTSELETENDQQDERISSAESSITNLDQRVGDLEAGSGGSTNLTERVDALEEVTSELETENNQQDERISLAKFDILILNQRVGDLEAGGGGNTNLTDLTERVDGLEEVTSELETENDQQDERISSTESDISDLDQRVGDIESGGGGENAVYHDSIFLAALSITVDGSADPIIFDRAEINPGGHYNPSTGVYTVPYDGIYQFSVNSHYDDGHVSILVYVDGSPTGSHYDGMNTPYSYYRSPTFLLELTAGQEVYARQAWSTGGAVGCYYELCSYFTGHLISAA